MSRIGIGLALRAQRGDHSHLDLLPVLVDECGRPIGADQQRVADRLDRSSGRGLKTAGPDPVLTALTGFHPRSRAARKTVANAIEFFSTHAASGRMDYPRFAAQGLPIASGIVESACNSVVCQRTKGAGKRWWRLGAQTILNLRCLRLQPSRWTAFFRRQPSLRRPPVATLRQEEAA